MAKYFLEESPAIGVQELLEEIKRLNEMLDESEERFRSMFGNNHIAKLLLEPETGRIIDANDKACRFFGYKKAELKTRKITEFNLLPEEKVLQEMDRAKRQENNFFIFQHKTAGGVVKTVEVFSGPIKIEGKLLLYSIFIDITDRIKAEEEAKEYSTLLEGILCGIPDIIGVYKPDHSIVFYNQKGYQFFNTTYEAVQGKKCFQMLGRDQHCQQCGVVKALKSKKMEIIEKYIPELDLYMDCRYNPILNQDGQVILIVEQMRDITAQIKAQENIKRSEERYRNLFDLSPDGTGVLRKGRILIVNNKLANILGANSSKEIIGKNFFSYVHKDYSQIAKERMKKVLLEGATTSLHEYKFIKEDGSIIDVELAAAPFSYQGKPSIQFVLRDVTERKKQLERAAKIQRQRLDTRFPLSEKGKLEMVYAPADTVSGDFFHFYKYSDEKMVGLLGDVSGKGVSAALSTSALKVLFYDIASLTSDPLEIVNELNKEAPSYFGEEYVAACCFSFDFAKKEVKVAAAGINTMIHYAKGIYCLEEIIRGPFLGMMDMNLFETKTFTFSPGDRFYFYTDGLEQVFSNQLLMEKFACQPTIRQQKNFLLDIIKFLPTQEDDCTWLAIEIV